MSNAVKKAWATRRRVGRPSRDINPPEQQGKRHSKRKKWMGNAVKRPGALRAKVEQRYEKESFDKKGRIKPSVLQVMKSDPNLDARTKQQVQFRLNTAGVRR